MKVLFDHQIFEEQRIGGVSRYFIELIKHFPEDVKYEISVLFTNNIYLLNYKNEGYKPIVDHRQEFIKGLEFPGKGRVFEALIRRRPQNFPVFQKENINYSLNLINCREYDVFHPTNHSSYFLDNIGSKPFVVTIHDMIQELYPEYFQSYDERKRILALKADHIIAVSSNTKKDIIELFGISENKISVIHHGANIIGKESTTESKRTPKEYLLFVGSRDGYKNFEFLIKAIAEILIKYNYKLICTGQAFSPYEINLIKELNLGNNIDHFFSSDAELYNLYINATGLVFPSLYEGFGMPVLEAFACECPVLLSNCGSLQEIAGEGALYFDPKSKSDLQLQVKKLLDSITLQESLIKKGKDRLAFFSWEKASLLTKEVYTKVA